MTARRTGAAFVLVTVALCLTACTPAIATAWKLNADGSVSVTACEGIRASRVDVIYLSQDNVIAELASEGEERWFGDGHQASIAPDKWLSSVGLSSVAEWDAVRVTFSAAPFPLGTSHRSNRAGDSAALNQVFEAEIDRSELRVGQWVWDEAGSDCEILPEFDGEPVYTGALSHETYERLLNGNPDLDSLTDALVDLGRIAPILGFQALLLDEIATSTLPDEGPRQTLSRIRPTAAPSALLAAELAATRLGFVWNPDAVRASETD